MKPIKLNFSNGFDTREVLIDEEVLVQYEQEFITSYAKQKNLYSTGKMSGDVLYESRTYGEIEQFAKNLPSALLLEKSILANNPNLGEVTVTRFTWISLDEYVFDNCLGEIEMAIRNENGWGEKEERNYKFNTYEYDGKEVVYVSFYQACYGEATVFAVPVELAYKYKLGDFDGREMSRFDGLWNLLEPYETNIAIEYDDDMGLEDFPYALIETFNYD